MREALADPDNQGTIVEVEHPRFGTVRQVNTPVRFPAAEARQHSPGPALGEHTETVLRTYLDYGADKIEQLREIGAI